ncbi:hypothetical protein RHMOL_Rhmol09G0132100 [Rhododendron molle]|uniref:Uncharacterized protein n=1 Tax=Rhododendron molle TaxID=49168 RepID=A0ACC0MEL7_RHOML|nr:hypothetical protein RHMOL_Rhmol09G0132100 [Rhododendron molle]
MRNEHIFQNKALNWEEVVDLIKLRIAFWVKSKWDSADFSINDMILLLVAKSSLDSPSSNGWTINSSTEYCYYSHYTSSSSHITGYTAAIELTGESNYTQQLYTSNTMQRTSPSAKGDPNDSPSWLGVYYILKLPENYELPLHLQNKNLDNQNCTISYAMQPTHNSSSSRTAHT